MTRIAIPFWKGRVSPVFDVAGNVLIVDIEDGAERSRRNEPFTEMDPQRRAAHLAATGAKTLICGAISKPLEVAIVSAGLELIAQTCGGLEHVLTAYMNGSLSDGAYRMPGCRGRRRRRGAAGW